MKKIAKGKEKLKSGKYAKDTEIWESGMFG